MTNGKLWALAGLFPVLLGGCGGEEEVAVEEAPEVVVTEPAVPAAAPMDTGAMAMGGMATTVAMQPLQNSGVTGEATLTPQGSQTQVMVRLTGLQPGEHPGHIHSGTCENVGPPVQPLQPITAGGDGTGTMTTTVPLEPNTAMNGQHVVQYHAAGGGPGVVCGPIPQHQM